MIPVGQADPGGLLLLAVDLGVFHWKAHEVSVLAALIWSGVWVGLALLFRPEAGEESAVAPGCREKVANGQMADRWSPMPRM